MAAMCPYFKDKYILFRVLLNGKGFDCLREKLLL